MKLLTGSALTRLHEETSDKSPRTGTGRRVATIRVLSITREPLSAMPDSDYEAEGFAWLACNTTEPLGDVWGIIKHYSRPGAPEPSYFRLAQQCSLMLWTLRFEVVA